MFVAIDICSIILSRQTFFYLRQAYFCHNKRGVLSTQTRFCRQTFVAPANDVKEVQVFPGQTAGVTKSQAFPGQTTKSQAFPGQTTQSQAFSGQTTQSQAKYKIILNYLKTNALS